MRDVYVIHEHEFTRARARLSVLVCSLSPTCNTACHHFAPESQYEFATVAIIAEHATSSSSLSWRVYRLILSNRRIVLFATPCHYSLSISIYSFFYSLHRKIFFSEAFSILHVMMVNVDEKRAFIKNGQDADFYNLICRFSWRAITLSFLNRIRFFYRTFVICTIF